MFTFIDVWRRTHQFKTSTGETSAFDAELNTATDSVNDEAAATSTNMGLSLFGVGESVRW